MQFPVVEKYMDPPYSFDWNEEKIFDSTRRFDVAVILMAPPLDDDVKFWNKHSQTYWLDAVYISHLFVE